MTSTNDCIVSLEWVGRAYGSVVKQRCEEYLLKEGLTEATGGIVSLIRMDVINEFVDDFKIVAAAPFTSE